MDRTTDTEATLAGAAVLGVALAASLAACAMERPVGDWSAVILSAKGREYVMQDGYCVSLSSAAVVTL